MKKNKRRMIIANKLHRDILMMVFFASLLPALIIAVCLYFLIFNVTAYQVGFPETIAYNILPAARIVSTILFISAPFSILLILILAHRLTHRIVGPFDRIIRELDECIEGKKHEHIILRKNDKFNPLVERINKLIDKIYRK
jgi:nitrogen fixation/metabolism regulation signal transduction histidine kinase